MRRCEGVGLAEGSPSMASSSPDGRWLRSVACRSALIAAARSSCCWRFFAQSRAAWEFCFAADISADDDDARYRRWTRTTAPASLAIGELVFRRRVLTVYSYRCSQLVVLGLCFPRRARRLEHTVKDNPTPKLSYDETLRNFSWRPSESGNASWSGPPAAGRVGAGLVGHTLPSATSVRASAGAWPSVASAVRGGRECSTSRGAARCDEGHH